MNVVLSGSQGPIQIGDVYKISILLDGNEIINAAEITISWTDSLLNLVGFDFQDSAMPIEAERSISQSAVRMARGVLPPGITGIKLFGKIDFRAIASGLAVIGVDGSSKILRVSDNTNVLNGFTDQTIRIVSDAISPAPPQNLNVNGG